MSRQKNDVSLISSSTILILSGIILGTAFNQFIDEKILPYFVAVGVSGVLTFLVLDLAATRRSLETLEAEREQVEGRLDKHLFSLSNHGFELPPEESHEDESEEFEIEHQEEKPADQLVASA